MTTNTTQPRTYMRGIHASAVTCGARFSASTLIHDGAIWETFTDADLDSYLAEGVAKAHQHIARIANLSHKYSERDEEELVFMIEALLHARHARDAARES
jgi:hypothetical protein